MKQKEREDNREKKKAENKSTGASLHAWTLHREPQTLSASSPRFHEEVQGQILPSIGAHPPGVLSTRPA